MVSTLSKRGEDALVAEEGEVLRAYRCPAGVWTIGVGLTAGSGVVTPKAGMTITQAQSRALLRKALERNYIPRVQKAKLDGKQNVFDGSVMFDFNTGQIHKASWVSMFLSGSYTLAEKSFKSWNKGGGKVLAGLTKRRDREWRIIRNNTYPAEGGTQSVSATSAAVTAYQQNLADLGFYKGKIDGIAGPETLAAVIAFQRASGLTADGVVGPATRAALVRALDKKAQASASSKSAGGGALAGGGSDIAINGNVSTETLLWMIGAGAAALAIVTLLFVAWRYRGPLFAWLPEGVKDVFENAGVTIGRRVRT
ncbi:hypothetical protein ATER59S_01870 [Aquamicrobium terrae]